jgi:hypothetical protein
MHITLCADFAVGSALAGMEDADGIEIGRLAGDSLLGLEPTRVPDLGEISGSGRRCMCDGIYRSRTSVPSQLCGLVRNWNSPKATRHRRDVRTLRLFGRFGPPQTGQSSLDTSRARKCKCDDAARSFNGGNWSFESCPLNVRYSRSIIQSRRSASVKSFGRRQASESPRGTNPRCAGRDLWGFDVLVVPGRAVVKHAALHRMRIGRAFSGDHDRDPGALAGVFDDGGRDQRK